MKIALLIASVAMAGPGKKKNTAEPDYLGAFETAELIYDIRVPREDETLLHLAGTLMETIRLNVNAGSGNMAAQVKAENAMFEFCLTKYQTMDCYKATRAASFAGYLIAK